MADDVKIAQAETFDVGGVEMTRPFCVRRLGHFGLDVHDVEACRDFYERMMGLRVSDPLDLGGRLPPEEKDQHGSTIGYFMRHGGDHHSFVIFPRRVRQRLMGKRAPDMTVNQITWQVSSLREVVSGNSWLKDRIRVVRTGRDMPGSNWHFYPVDPAGHTNELYYGIEQIGWDGLSKPKQMHRKHYDQPPELPHRSEMAEIEEGLAAGVDIRTGVRPIERLPETHDVGGILLGRPFKVVKIGPVRIFVPDMAQALGFYRDTLGLAITEEVNFRGHVCYFLRANTEHHSMALYPRALRAELGLSDHTSLMSIGMQLGSYEQLRRARAFLAGHGHRIVTLPQELFPGVEHNAFVVDPDGHLVQLYFGMEQVGWDGRPRPAGLRPAIDNENWPEKIAASSTAYAGEVYLGPWN